VELAPALYHNTSIKELDISENNLHGMESAEALRDIIRRNKTMTTLDLSGICFGQYTVAVERIADGLGSNSTLLKINLSRCALRDDGVSILAQNLGSRMLACFLTLWNITATTSRISISSATLLVATEQASWPGHWEITRCQTLHASLLLQY
jgi:hypothetical protein